MMENSEAGGSWRGLVWRHVVELAILGGLLVAGIAIPVTDPGFEPWGPSDRVGSSLHALCRGGVGERGFALPSLLCLLLVIRFARSRFWLYIGILASVVMPYVLLYYRITRPFLAGINADPGLRPSIQLLMPQVWVPMWATSIRQLLLVVLPILSALYCVRGGFGWIRYLCGWAVGLALVYIALFFSWLSDTSWSPAYSWPLVVAIVINGLAAVALVALPLQRKALERFTGLELSRSTSVPVSRNPEGWMTWAIGHMLVLGVVGLFVVLALLGPYECRQLRQFYRGIEAAQLSPGATNAFDALKTLFSKDMRLSDGKRARESRESVLSHSMDGMSTATQCVFGGVPVMSRESLAQAVKTMKRTEVDDVLSTLTPYTRQLEQAAEADCLVSCEDLYVALDFLPLRVASRAIMLRANISIVENRTDAALRDARTLLQIAWLMNNDSTARLVTHMIGCAIRQMGVSVLQNYFLYYQDDPKALAALRVFLSDNRRLVHVSFPLETLRRTEMMMAPIAVNIELMLIGFPALSRVFTNYYGVWAQYDEVMLCAAIEAWRHDKGTLPERLEQLAPEYLPLLPKDPHEGKPYKYERIGDGYRVTSEYNIRLGEKSPFHWSPLESPSDRDKKDVAEFLAIVGGKPSGKNQR